MEALMKPMFILLIGLCVTLIGLDVSANTYDELHARYGITPPRGTDSRGTGSVVGLKMPPISSIQAPRRNRSSAEEARITFAMCDKLNARRGVTCEFEKNLIADDLVTLTFYNDSTAESFCKPDNNIFKSRNVDVEINSADSYFTVCTIDQ